MSEVMIYLMRHGKTVANTQCLVQGSSDSPLMPEGILQAKTVGHNLKDMVFKTAYSGTLGRQIDTLKYVLEENNSPVKRFVHEGFNEWHYGGFEGKSDEVLWRPIFEEFGIEFDMECTRYAEILEILSDRGIADKVAKNDPKHSAETYDEIIKRAKAAITELVNETLKAGGGNALAVSSGNQIPSILEAIMPGKYRGEAIENCSMTMIKYKDNEYSLYKIGDLGFLKDSCYICAAKG